jgi:hypothetical protein
MTLRVALAVCLTVTHAISQSVTVNRQPSLVMPVLVDSNSPAYWYDSQFHLVNSSGSSLITRGPNQFFLNGDEWAETIPVEITSWEHGPLWIEATYLDPDDGRLWAWYHHEPEGICAGSLTAPVIGALVSEDGGRKYHDLGIVLSSADPPNCSAQNGFFASGHGDFSVAIQDGFVYFIFSSYGGPVERQGIAMARMSYEHRFQPEGTVYKYFGGDWTEPGLGGEVSPVFPALVSWAAADTDSFWGPSVHWNYHLGKYVVLLSRACCAPRWPQEGIYVAFTEDLSNPRSWSTPKRILSADDIGYELGWYPQVLGTAFGDTDSVAGRESRLYVKGISAWEIIFDP